MHTHELLYVRQRFTCEHPARLWSAREDALSTAPSAGALLEPVEHKIAERRNETDAHEQGEAPLVRRLHIFQCAAHPLLLSQRSDEAWPSKGQAN